MRTLTMKFGGRSVGTAAALAQVLSIILHEHKRWDRLLVITSALDGVTDMLLEAAHLAQVNNQRGYRRIIATLRNRHLSLVQQLPLSISEHNTLQADIDRLLFEMLDVCQTVSSHPSETLSPEVSDSIAGVGEQLAARIIAALMRQNDLRGVAIDAKEILITDDTFGNATPNLELTLSLVQQHLQPMLERQIIPVVTGFIGSTSDGRTTTLGRGGSDYTASILSLCTQSEEVWLWSDVDGMMSSDPREVHDARVISEMTYNEVAELAYFGARILHARMIGPLREHQIPLRVKNVFKPQLPGTLVHDRVSSDTSPHLKAVSSIQGLGLSSMHSGSLASITRIMDAALSDTFGTEAEVMIASQSSTSSFLCYIVPTSAGIDALDNLRSAVDERLISQSQDALWASHPVTVITVVSERLNDHPVLAAEVLKVLDHIPIIGLAQGPAQCSLSIIVRQQDGEASLQRVHDLIIRSD